MSTRTLLYAALVLLFVLHNDWWSWDRHALIAGLPVSLLYHLAYTVVTAVVLLLLVRHAWPDHLRGPRDPEGRT